jgi:hypothetical protein
MSGSLDRPGADPEYLRADFGQTGFLIPRADCLATVYYPAGLGHRDGRAFRPGLFAHNGQELPVFDLDQAIAAVFGVKPPTAFPLALVVSLETARPETLARLEAACRRQDLAFCPGRLACALSCELAFLTLADGERRLFPAAIRAQLASRGLAGCRFPAVGRIDYFLDLESLMCQALAKAA